MSAQSPFTWRYGTKGALTRPSCAPNEDSCSRCPFGVRRSQETTASQHMVLAHRRRGCGINSRTGSQGQAPDLTKLHAGVLEAQSCQLKQLKYHSLPQFRCGS